MSTRSGSNMMNLLAYFAFIFIGFAVMLGWIFNDTSFGYWIHFIGLILACIVVGIM